MANDTPKRRRQRLQELRARGNTDTGTATPENNGPQGQRRGGRRQGSGEGRLLERFPKLRERFEQRGESANETQQGQGKPLLRELIKRRRGGGQQNAAQEGGRTGGVKALTELDDSQLEERAAKLRAKLDEIQLELDCRRERRGKTESTDSEG